MKKQIVFFLLFLGLVFFSFALNPGDQVTITRQIVPISVSSSITLDESIIAINESGPLEQLPFGVQTNLKDESTQFYTLVEEVDGLKIITITAL